MSWFPDLDLGQTLLDCLTHRTCEASSDQASMITIAPTDMSLHSIESFQSVEPIVERGNWLSEDTGTATDGWTSIEAADLSLPGDPSHTCPVSNNSYLPWSATGYDAYPQPKASTHTGRGLPPQPVGPTWARPMMAAPTPDNLDMLKYISQMLEYWTTLEQEKHYRNACRGGWLP